MSKSAIYTANTSNQSVIANGVINPGAIIRRYGPNINLTNNAIQIDGAGYYKINVNATVIPTAVGTVGISVLKDDTAIPGASAKVTTAATGDVANLCVSAVVREFCPCEDISNLTFVLTGIASNVTNFAVTVDKM